MKVAEFASSLAASLKSLRPPDGVGNIGPALTELTNTTQRELMQALAEPSSSAKTVAEIFTKAGFNPK
jgi:hypothetical protein